MKKTGFTLLEILISMALIAMVFTVAGSVLFSSLRTSRKASAVAVAKSEGAFAINAMSDFIRYAQDIQCHATDEKLQVNRTNQQSVVYSFDSSKIASDSGTFAVPGSIHVDLTTTKVAVSLTGCSRMFTCSSDGRSVQICFAIDNAIGTDLSDMANDTGGLMFQTQITLTNQTN